MHGLQEHLLKVCDVLWVDLHGVSQQHRQRPDGHQCQADHPETAEVHDGSTLTAPARASARGSFRILGELLNNGRTAQHRDCNQGNRGTIDDVDGELAAPQRGAEVKQEHREKYGYHKDE